MAGQQMLERGVAPGRGRWPFPALAWTGAAAVAVAVGALWLLAPTVGGRHLGIWIGRMLFDPHAAAAAVSRDPVAGWWVAISYSLAYAGTAGLLAGRGFRPVLEPLLRIPEDRYYAWQTLFTVPVGAGAMVLGWGTLALLSRVFGWDGDIWSLWAPFALAMVAPTAVTMWVPETLGAPFAPPGDRMALWPEAVDAWRQLLGFVWCVVVAIVAVDAVTALAWWQSAIVGFAGSAVTGITMPLVLR